MKKVLIGCGIATVAVIAIIFVIVFIMAAVATNPFSSPDDSTEKITADIEWNESNPHDPYGMYLYVTNTSSHRWYGLKVSIKYDGREYTWAKLNQNVVFEPGRRIEMFPGMLEDSGGNFIDMRAAANKGVVKLSAKISNTGAYVPIEIINVNTLGPVNYLSINSVVSDAGLSITFFEDVLYDPQVMIWSSSESYIASLPGAYYSNTCYYVGIGGTEVLPYLPSIYITGDRFISSQGLILGFNLGVGSRFYNNPPGTWKISVRAKLTSDGAYVDIDFPGYSDDKYPLASWPQEVPLPTLTVPLPNLPLPIPVG